MDGVAGGGLTPWAVIGSNASADQVGAAPFGTVVKSRDYQLGTAGGAIGIRDRVELSFARQDFDTMATGTALGLPNLHLKQNIYGVKVKLSGNAILDQDTWAPQMAVGALYKDLNAGVWRRRWPRSAPTTAVWISTSAPPSCICRAVCW